MSPEPTPDQIAAAIAATAEPDVKPIRVQLKLPRDRTGLVVLPEDINGEEVLAILAYLTGTVFPQVFREQAIPKPPAPRILRV